MSAEAGQLLNPLIQLFPRDQYGKQGNGLQFLIALKQPLRNIQDYLDKHPELLNGYKQKFFNLSPLAVCAMAGRYDVAELLISRGADPKVVDIHGFSPLHHATVRQDLKMKELILKTNQAGLKTLRNCLGQTYEEIERLFGRPLPKDDEHVFYFKNATGQIVQGTALQFKEMTGKQFVLTSIFTTESLYFQWLKNEFRTLPPISEAQNLSMRYEVYLANPPRIYLDKKGPQNWGVFAGEIIKADQVFCTYRGHQTQDDFHTEYQFRDMDGRQFCNEGPLINDGFPNCGLSRIFYRGEWISVAWAFDDIRPGEELLLHYGDGHVVKARRHFELNPPSLERFCKEHSLSQLCKQRIRGQLDQPHEIRMNYLLCTPSSLADLVLRNIISIKDATQCISVLKSMDLSFQTLSFHLPILCIVLLPLEGHVLKAEIYLFFLKLNQQLSCYVFFAVLELMEKTASPIKTAADWEKLKARLSGFLEIYLLIEEFVRTYLGEKEEQKHLDPIIAKLSLCRFSSAKEFASIPMFFLNSRTVYEKKTSQYTTSAKKFFSAIEPIHEALKKNAEAFSS
jgi:hypothetical protein